MLSVLDAPVSVAAVISGADGAEGALVSMVMLRADEAGPRLPAVSTILAVMVCPPSDRELEGVKLQFPDPSAVAVPKTVDPSNTCTVLLGAAVPVKVGVLSLVRLSVLDAPVSVAAVMSGVDGIEVGAVVSMVMLRGAEAGLTFPAPSVAVAVIV
jgi:hypothetical protein